MARDEAQWYALAVANANGGIWNDALSIHPEQLARGIVHGEEVFAGDMFGRRPGRDGNAFTDEPVIGRWQNTPSHS